MVAEHLHTSKAIAHVFRWAKVYLHDDKKSRQTARQLLMFFCIRRRSWNWLLFDKLSTTVRRIIWMFLLLVSRHSNKYLMKLFPWQLLELIPRPARACQDPPMYLRLRMGRQIGKTTPLPTTVMSYGKNKLRPEYWFSIPKNKWEKFQTNKKWAIFDRNELNLGGIWSFWSEITNFMLADRLIENFVFADRLFEYFLTFLNFSQGGWALQIPQLLGLSHLRWFGRRGAQDSRLRINPTRHRMGEQSNFQQGKKNKKKSPQITLVRSLIDWLIDFRTAPTSVTRSANTRENRGRWVDESCRASVILNRRIFLCPPKSIDRWNVLDEKCFLNEILFFYLFFRFGFLIIPRKSPLRISSGVDPNLTRRVAGLNFA